MSENAKKRRAAYQRSLTVPARGDEDKTEDQLAGLLSVSSASSPGEEKPKVVRQASKLSDPGLSGRRRPPPLIRRNTVICGDPLIEASDMMMTERTSTISRSLSTPSVILNKVREKIRRHAYQTSDWPPPSAVIRQHYHEKRRNSLPDKDFILLTPRADNKLDIDTNEWGSTASSEKIRANRSPRTQRYRRKSPVQERCGSEPQMKSPTGGGVICSKNDLKAIMYEFKDTRGKLEKSKTLTSSPRVASRFQHSATLGTPLLRKQVSFDAGDDFGSCQDALIPSQSETTNDFPDVFMGECSSKPVIQTQNTDAYYDLKGSLCGDANPTIVRDVVYDEHGQTWDVYGADFDPEIVGDAIQRHLNSIMKRNKNNTSASSLSDKQEPKRARTSEFRGPDAHSQSPTNQTPSSKPFMRWFCLFGRNN